MKLLLVFLLFAALVVTQSDAWGRRRWFRRFRFPRIPIRRLIPGPVGIVPTFPGRDVADETQDDDDDTLDEKDLEKFLSERDIEDLMDAMEEEDDESLEEPANKE